MSRETRESVCVCRGGGRGRGRVTSCSPLILSCEFFLSVDQQQYYLVHRPGLVCSIIRHTFTKLVILIKILHEKINVETLPVRRLRGTTNLPIVLLSQVINNSRRCNRLSCTRGTLKTQEYQNTILLTCTKDKR